MHLYFRPLHRAAFRGCWLVLPALLAGGIFGASALAQEQEVLEADRQMAAAAAAKDDDALRTFLLSDVRFLGFGTLEKGPDAVLRAWEPYFDPDSQQAIRWQPQTALVARSNDLAVTLGTFQVVELLDGGGEKILGQGRYLTVWKRQGGRWKVAADGTLTEKTPAGLELKVETGQRPPRAILQGSTTMAARAVRVFPSDAGDLAYTFGEYRAADPNGGRQPQEGVFLAVLQRDEEGRWQVYAASFPPPR